MRPQIAYRLAAAALALLCGSGLPAQQAGAPNVAEQRARIQADRLALEAKFDAELAACRQRFAVTACVDDVRLRRREALAAPRARELALDDSERQGRAQARREAVREKQLRAAEASANAPAAAASVVQRPARSVPAPAARAASAASAASTASSPSALPTSRAASEAARRAEAAQARRERIARTQLRIDARQAERARKGPVPPPLPVPGAASAAR